MAIGAGILRAAFGDTCCGRMARSLVFLVVYPHAREERPAADADAAAAAAAATVGKLLFHIYSAVFFCYITYLSCHSPVGG